MAETNPTGRPIDADGLAVGHLVVSSIYLTVGAVLTVLALAGAALPGAFGGILAHGTTRPAAMTAVMLGWLTPALIGAAYYVLPRLTGTALWRPELGRLALAALAVLPAAGIAVVAFGLGDGTGPLFLPWWIDLPVLLVLLVPISLAVQTVRNRTEKSVFVTLWFVLAGLAWLPLLYVMGAIPNLNPIGRALQDVNFTAGFTTMWVTTVGVGVAYYVVAKGTGNPLGNRQLVRAGFWSLAFAAFWAGPAQIAFGPTPDWVDTVAAVLTLALPVAAVANGTAIATTIGDAWSELSERPMLAATAGGIAFSVVVGAASSVAAFRSSAAMVGLTAFWDGVLHMALFGVGGLFVGAWAYQALPAMTGRRLASIDNARRHIRLTIWGAGLTGAILITAGVVAGFAWTGGSFLGDIVPAGTAWSEANGTATVLLGVAALTSVVTMAGQLQFAFNVAQTITSGRVTEQEVLVERTTA